MFLRSKVFISFFQDFLWFSKVFQNFPGWSLGAFLWFPSLSPLHQKAEDVGRDE